MSGTMNERELVDPFNRYPAPGLTLVETQAARLLRLFPMSRAERTRDFFQIDVIDPDLNEPGVVLFIHAEGLEFRMPSHEWIAGSGEAVPTSRTWRRLRWTNVTSDAKLAQMVQAAMSTRRAEYVPCRGCGRAYPPEFRSGKMCLACASRKRPAPASPGAGS